MLGSVHQFGCQNNAKFWGLAHGLKWLNTEWTSTTKYSWDTNPSRHRYYWSVISTCVQVYDTYGRSQREHAQHHDEQEVNHWKFKQNSRVTSGHITHVHTSILQIVGLQLTVELGAPWHVILIYISRWGMCQNLVNSPLDVGYSQAYVHPWC